MIDRAEDTVVEPPVTYKQMHCAICGGKLCRVSLTPGNYAVDRCHHKVIINGKRQTCGYETRTGPTR